MSFDEFKQIQARLEAQQHEQGDEDDDSMGSEISVGQISNIQDGQQLDKQLTMIGIFGIRDILRPEIKDAVQKCHQANVNVRMVTGDN